MLGLVLLYFAGKAFYDLAGRHGRSKWGFAILGVLSYYGGLFFGGILIALIYEFGLSQSIDNVNDMLLGVMAIPVGVLTCWGLYKGLEARWAKPEKPFASEGILDADLRREEPQS
jgi:hypothetical protein